MRRGSGHAQAHGHGYAGRGSPCCSGKPRLTFLPSAQIRCRHRGQREAAGSSQATWQWVQGDNMGSKLGKQPPRPSPASGNPESLIPPRGFLLGHSPLLLLAESQEPPFLPPTPYQCLDTQRFRGMSDRKQSPFAKPKQTPYCSCLTWFSAFTAFRDIKLVLKEVHKSL